MSIIDANSKHDQNSPRFSPNYSINISVKKNSTGSVKILRKRLEQYFENDKEMIVEFSEDENQLKVLFQLESAECEKLKDMVARWEEV